MKKTKYRVWKKTIRSKEKTVKEVFIEFSQDEDNKTSDWLNKLSTILGIIKLLFTLLSFKFQLFFSTN